MMEAVPELAVAFASVLASAVALEVAVGAVDDASASASALDMGFAKVVEDPGNYEDLQMEVIPSGEHDSSWSSVPLDL